MVRLRAIHSRCDSQPVGQVTEWVRRDAARGFWSHGCRRPSDGLTCLAGFPTGSINGLLLRLIASYTYGSRRARSLVEMKPTDRYNVSTSSFLSRATISHFCY